MLAKQQVAFFEKAKQENRSKFQEIQDSDAKLSYFKQCLKAQVLVQPLLNRIVDHVLVLKQIVLNQGHCNAINSVLGLQPNLLHHLTLDANALKGSQLRLILEGILLQSGNFKSLTIHENELDTHCITAIAQLAQRRLPDHLDQLHIIQCKIGWRETEQLLEQLRSCQLSQLSLVSVQLSEQCIPHLEHVIDKAKRLVYLDISWNKLLPK